MQQKVNMKWQAWQEKALCCYAKNMKEWDRKGKTRCYAGYPMEETETRIKHVRKNRWKCIGRDQARDMLPVPRQIIVHPSFRGEGLASLVGTVSAGVSNCGLEGESVVSGLPLPHESSRMICAASGALGLAWDWSDFLVAARVLEGDEGSSRGGSVR